MNGTKVLKIGDRFVFLTSGTTGIPKRVNRCKGEIFREVEYWGRVLRPRRILRVTKPEHIYGHIWGVLLPESLAIEMVNVRGWSAGEFASFVRPGDLVIGFAGAWERWREVVWPPGVTAVHAGDPAPAGVLAGLLEKGLERWVDVYGCTELGAVGVRENGAREYELMPWWPDRLEGIEAKDELAWTATRRFQLGPRKVI
jgi:4-coumarate--CoA ligase